MESLVNCFLHCPHNFLIMAPIDSGASGVQPLLYLYLKSAMQRHFNAVLPSHLYTQLKRISFQSISYS